MLATAFLVLMVAGVGRAALSDLKLNGRFTDRTLRSRNGRPNPREQLHHQIQSSRSLDMESFNIHVSPTSGRVSLPTIIRLQPPALQPSHRHVNMPMRFGRDGVHDHDDDDHTSTSNANMPQRFGRSRKALQPSGDCPEARGVPSRPFRYARKGSWSLMRTLVKAQLLKTAEQHVHGQKSKGAYLRSSSTRAEDLNVTPALT